MRAQNWVRVILIVLAIGVLAFVAWMLLRADEGGLPRFITALYDTPNGDKLGHFLLMGLLAFVVTLALPRRLRLPGLGLLAVLLAGEEYSQRFFAHRTSSWLDLAASLAGVIVFGGLSMVVTGTFHKIPREGTNHERDQ